MIPYHRQLEVHRTLMSFLAYIEWWVVDHEIVNISHSLVEP